MNLLREHISSLPPRSSIAVIGCGLTGSEIIGTLIDYKKFNIHAIDASPRPLMTFSDELSTFTLDLWKTYNVSLIDNNTIRFGNSDKKIDYDLAIWCGGIKKTLFTDKILSRLNISNNRGIPIDSFLRVKDTNNVFAMGDCTDSKYPSSAQVA